ncbi:alpha/beta-hydrolase [Meredithblackwellia eburnea MCA 4105]
MPPLDEIQSFSTSIAECAMPTVGVYMKAQGARAREILRAPPVEHQYGPTERHKLDIFYPEVLKDGEKAPVMIFIYGGGFVRGEKRFGPGFIHGNVGRYFADRGFVTVIPDYRLVGTHEGAHFPSGGEDISLVLEFISKSIDKSADLDRVFLLGNSAGGIHLSTFLFHEDPSILPLTSLPIKVRGAVLLSVPFDFKECEPYRETINEQYYGSPKGHGKTPRELRIAKGGDDPTPLLIVTAERDADNEILSANRRFLALYSSSGPLSGNAKPSEISIKRHNHISPPIALGLGGEEDEWGDVVVQWMLEKC